MSRKRDSISIKEAIDDLLKAYRLKHKIQALDIRAKWEKIVGKLVNKYTESVSINNHKLTVRMIAGTPPVLKTELNYSKTELIEQINREFGNTIVLDIEFR